jgi:hypothetical protein
MAKYVSGSYPSDYTLGIVLLITPASFAARLTINSRVATTPTRSAP